MKIFYGDPGDYSSDDPGLPEEGDILWDGPSILYEWNGKAWS